MLFQPNPATLLHHQKMHSALLCSMLISSFRDGQAVACLASCLMQTVTLAGAANFQMPPHHEKNKKAHPVTWFFRTILESVLKSLMRSTWVNMTQQITHNYVNSDSSSQPCYRHSPLWIIKSQSARLCGWRDLLFFHSNHWNIFWILTKWIRTIIVGGVCVNNSLTIKLYWFCYCSFISDVCCKMEVLKIK